MRLIKARVQNYRSVLDSGEFEIDKLKTIFVGPNEAGKTVLLKAIQQLNAPPDIGGFEALRDYPRSKYDSIQRGEINPADVTVVTGYFTLTEEDKAELPNEFHDCLYVLSKQLDNSTAARLENAPDFITMSNVKADLLRMVAHMDSTFLKSSPPEGTEAPSRQLDKIISQLKDEVKVEKDLATSLKAFLEKNIVNIEEGNSNEEGRQAKLLNLLQQNQKRQEIFSTLTKRLPVFVLFNNYYRVKPVIHLEHLAQRLEQNNLDDEYFDYGNSCLLKLLGFTARQLSDLGKAKMPGPDDTAGLKQYRDKLDNRQYMLNAASVRLTREIRSVWSPNPERPEADKLKLLADGQYLKVVVEDDLGVDIELDQRSEGFQWLVSFFVVFFAEAMDKHKNAILLLDEPGMSLHALKQRDFRETISRLAESNQTVYSTHSPFLVGPNELDIVRVVEMKSRSEGTKVHKTISSSDPAGLLPLQEALGYDLAQSLFAQQQNLVLEGLTDYWYIEATADLLRAAGIESLNEKIALVFANTAGKVVYYATILYAHKLKVAALLDSDAAGDQAAIQENLVHTLGAKNILRTKDYCTGVPKAEIEDLLRKTLLDIVKDQFSIDCSAISESQPARPIVDIFTAEIPSFSKYKLAKAYVRWTRSHEAKDLTAEELKHWGLLFKAVNKALK